MSELSQLKWRCRRGVKELDIVLNKYLEEHYESADDCDKMASKTAFKELVDLEDPVLYAMLLGNIEAENSGQEAVLHKLRNMYSA